MVCSPRIGAVLTVYRGPSAASKTPQMNGPTGAPSVGAPTAAPQLASSQTSGARLAAPRPARAAPSRRQPGSRWSPASASRPGT
eukprot:12252937-Alexandrium_andersonii.AAC.1